MLMLWLQRKSSSSRMENNIAHGKRWMGLNRCWCPCWLHGYGAYGEIDGDGKVEEVVLEKFELLE